MRWRNPSSHSDLHQVPFPVTSDAGSNLRKETRQASTLRALTAATLAAVLLSADLPAGAAAAAPAPIPPAMPAPTSSAPSSANEAAAASTARDNLHYTAVEGAHYHSVGLRSDGTVWAWGRNLWGELGATGKVRYYNTYSPIRIPRLENIIAISASGSSNKAALREDGSVWEWGGIQGLTQVDQVSNVKQISTGGHYNMALREDGTVYTWQIASYEIEAQKARKPTTVKGLANITYIVAAESTAYAVKKDGTVWRWDEPRTPGTAPSSPVKVKGLSNVRSITYGDDNLYAMDTKGKAWQVNAQGKVTAFHPELTLSRIDANASYVLLATTSGDVHTYGSRTVTGKQGKVNGLSNIADISAGTYHALALDAAGSIWGWGGNKNQEAGGPATSPGGMTYTPIQAPLGTDVYINGQLLEAPYATVATAATVQLPAKAVAAALGAAFAVHRSNDGSIDYYSLVLGDAKATIRPGDTELHVTIDGKIKDKIVPLPEPVGSYSGGTTLPYEALEALGLTVHWDAQRYILTIDDTH
ncbi:hypothetical protein [Paenibacillus sp. JJ-223]|uniref:RCC1 domain-containing protein n=1 Tax=Paenibacillus sp. JJ-223 TaxID=2905647 RepID=UPI001F3711AA|nr:hypothetical protein [Paenibacillus sp. JJ-223]CAH1224574.1 hypothetical protein PAECIP111890_05693 [Paenibacillus sp. JJ-223]